MSASVRVASPAKLDGDFDGDRLLPVGHAERLRRRRRGSTLSISALSAEAAARIQVAGGGSLVATRKAKSRVERHQRRQVELRPRLAALALGLGHSVQPDLEAVDRARHVQGLEDARMDLAELGQDGPGAELRPGRAARLPPGRSRAPCATWSEPVGALISSSRAKRSAFLRVNRVVVSRPWPNGGAHGATRIAAMAVRWPLGWSEWNTGPISNRATSAKPRLALRPAPSIRLGRMDGRMASRSAAMGLARIRLSGTPPNRSALARAVKLQVTASA